MDDLSIGALLFSIVLLLIFSAYFSSSETAMTALNPYRLRHLSKQGHGGAKRASKIRKRPESMLTGILIGNNLANFTAASLATLLAIRLLGESGIVAAPIICTIVFLVLAEVAPKRIALSYPERVALPSSYLLQPFLWLGAPVIWLVNGMANSLVRIFDPRSGPQGAPGHETSNNNLSPEELRTVVDEGADIADHPHNMMLGVLDLSKVTVDDIMVPRAEIVGIDLDDEMDEIISQIRSIQHTRLPVFKEDIDKIVGILHIRNAARCLLEGALTKDALTKAVSEAYFVPENTPLQIQLINFQTAKERIAMVVDEYGDIQGIVTIEDILEEIVGEFTTDLATTHVDIHPQEDNTYLIDGGAQLRLINRSLGWSLPVDGPKTLHGLITDHLETIPDSNLCFTLGRYRVEIIQIQDNMIRTAKLSESPAPLEKK